MRKRRLGRTCWEVSEISLGTVELGLDYGIAPAGAEARPSEAAAERLLHRALDLGINFIDTARVYGTSEAIIGRALRSRRSEYFLASKVPALEKDQLSGPALADKIASTVHESLRALQTDVIDLMMIHSASWEVIDRGEVIGVLEKLRDAGCIRFLGASLYGEEAALRAIRDGRYACLQIPYSALDRRPENRVLPAAQAADVGIVVRSVLLKGALTHRYRYLPDALAPLRSAARAMQELAQGEVRDLVELAYRYVLMHPAAHTALAGTGHLEELEAIVRCAGCGPLSEDLCRAIRAVSVTDETQLNPATWPS